MRLVAADGATLLDEVTYDTDGGWPTVNGRSLSLDSAVVDATGNDLASAWCGATVTMANGDRGTPGNPNTA